MLKNSTSHGSKVFDSVLIASLRVAGFTSASLLLLIVAFLIWKSFPAFSDIGIHHFFSDARWAAADASSPQFNVVPMILASVTVAGAALLIAAPLAIIVAAFINWTAPAAVREWLRRIIEVLAGIPSVVFGFWGLVTVVPLIAQIHPPGTSTLAGSLVLALMIFPTVCLLSDAAFRDLPKSSNDAADALGLSRWRKIWFIFLPATSPGIRLAVLLGMTRAIGETMVVLMLCGNVVKLPGNLFEPVRTLTANIALEMAYAYGQHQIALFFCGLLLTSIVTLLVLSSRINRNHAVNA